MSITREWLISEKMYEAQKDVADNNRLIFDCSQIME